MLAARFVSWCDYLSDRQWAVISRIPFVYRIYKGCSN